MFRSFQYSGQVATVSTVLGFMLGFVTTIGQPSVLFLAERGSGEVSLTGLFLLLALGLGVVITALAYRQNEPVTVIDATGQQIHVAVRDKLIARLATAFAAGLLLFTVTALLLYLIHLLFQGLMINRLWIIAATTLFAGIVGFGLAQWASNLKSSNLLRLAGLIGVTGIVLAALAVGDSLWWQRSLSYLGSTETAGIYFNIALIITGLLLMVVNQETLGILSGLVSSGLVSADYARWARIYMIAIPICVVGVGLFPTRITPLSDLLHNLSSHLMIVFFIILMLSTVNRQDSIHSRTFKEISRAAGWFIVACFALEKLEVINFVAFEIIILVPVGIWLALYQVQILHFAESGKAPDVQVPRPMTPLSVYALRTGLIMAVMGALLAVSYIGRGETVAFATLGQGITIADLWTILSFVLGAGVTALSYRRFAVEKPDLSVAERKALQDRGFWLARAVVAAAAGVITFVLTIALILGINLVFPNMMLNSWAAILMTAVYGGIAGGILAFWAGNLDNVNLLVLAAITIVLGMGAAALFIGDPDWWTISLSYLGSLASPVSIFFNLGLIMTGLILLIVNQDTISLLRVLRDEKRISSDYLMYVRWLLILIPIFLMAVGIFPRRISPLYNMLHNLGAVAMVLCFLFLAFFVVAGRRTIHPPRFVQQSRLLSVTILLLYGVYMLDVVNYVGFELLLFIPVGIWLLLYQFEIRKIARNEPTSPVSGSTELKSA